jgi:hypothetical protein
MNYKEIDDKYVRLPKALLKLYTLLPGFDNDCAVVHATLCDYVNEEYGYAWPSRYQLAMDCNISLRKLDKCLKTLAHYELITKKRGINNSNQYFVHEPLTVGEFFAKYPTAREEYEEREKKRDQYRSADKERIRQWRAQKAESQGQEE